MEEHKRHGQRDRDQRHVKRHLDRAEADFADLRQCADQPFTRHEQCLRRDLHADAEAQYRAAQQKENQLDRDILRLKPAEQVHAHVDEPAENHVDDDLQQLDRMVLPPQQDRLQYDEYEVHHKGKLAQRRREPQAEHIRYARDRRGAERRLGDQRYAE